MLQLTDQTAGIGGTYHGWGQVDQPRIDYILSRDFDQVLPPTVWTDERCGVYLSDHYPVVAQLRPLR